MGIFDFFKSDDKSYEKICEERANLKHEIAEALKDISFTQMEIKEVLNIVDQTESKISVLKGKLVGSNIGMESPIPLQEHVMDQISKLTDQMYADLKKKVDEIMTRSPNRFPNRF